MKDLVLPVGIKRLFNEEQLEEINKFLNSQELFGDYIEIVFKLNSEEVVELIVDSYLVLKFLKVDKELMNFLKTSEVRFIIFEEPYFFSGVLDFGK